jgi:uncharacterized protein
LQTAHEHALFFENRKGENLFGMLHRPERQTASDLAVVFCHPISWEKQFSYRAYSQFSRHLAGAGYTSFRFDAFGFGESDGELVDATVRSQVEDTLAAIDCVRNSTECTRFVLLGARFGGAIASLAAAESPDVDALILISPVVNGEAYWKEMVRFCRFGRMKLGQPLISTKQLAADLDSKGCAEIDGDLFGRGFVEELRAIDLTRQAQPFKGACLLSELASGGADRASFEALVDVLNKGGADVTSSFAEPKDFWIMQTRYEGYLPKQLYRRTSKWLGEVRPQ